MRRAAAAAAAVLTLTGCSVDSSPPEPLAIDDSATPSAAEPSPTASESTEDAGATRGELDEVGHDVHRGRVRAGDEQSRAVVEAWLAYWEVRLAAFHDVEVDPARLGTVATGEAADQVIAYVRGLEQQGQRTEGDLRMNVDRVQVRAGRATLRGCAENAGTDRGADGRPVEPLIPFYRVRGELVREGGAWRVSAVAASETPPC